MSFKIDPRLNKKVTKFIIDSNIYSDEQNLSKLFIYNKEMQLIKIPRFINW